MNKRITVFLPCRAGSERVPYKNIKPFAGITHGLFELKLNQLLRTSGVDEIVVSTNDKAIIEYLENNVSDKKIRLDIRPEHLCTSQTSTDELIRYVPAIITSGHVLWTHVTSPLCNESVYEKAVESYFENFEKGFDSLLSVNVLRKFLFREDFSAVNFDRTAELWPRTQTIKPIYEANSAFFLNPIQNYVSYNDRIGQRPFFYEMNQLESFDIDWEDDFKIAEIIWSKYIQNG